MKNIPLVVGNRVTFKLKRTGSIHTVIIQDELTLKKISDKEKYEILKVEAPMWEEIEFEKKELLTAEEKEFLRFLLKYYKETYRIAFCDADILFYQENDNGPDFCQYCQYPDVLDFEGVEENKTYTLKELGME